MRVDVVTLFPEIFPGPLGVGVVGRAIERGALVVCAHDLRADGIGPHRQVDDEPFGGGPGMVLRPEPIFAAVRRLRALPGHPRGRGILLGAHGRRFDATMARAMAAEPRLIVVCGRYQGIDERVVDGLDLDEVSIGDVVLSGGELAAMVVIEAVARHLPGTLGAPESLRDESFTRGTVEHPHYTRPATFEGRPVPEVLRGVRRPRRDRPLAPAIGGGAGRPTETRPCHPRPPAGGPRGPGPGTIGARRRSRRTNMNVIDLLERDQLKADVPELRPGDTVRVHVRVVEGTRERIQVFEGVTIGVGGGGSRRTFTVRRITHGVGVERTFLLHSPRIATVEVVRHGEVRRAKLYYLRTKVGKRARLRERRETTVRGAGAGTPIAPGSVTAEGTPEA